MRSNRHGRSRSQSSSGSSPAAAATAAGTKAACGPTPSSPQVPPKGLPIAAPSQGQASVRCPLFPVDNPGPAGGSFWCGPAVTVYSFIGGGPEAQRTAAAAVKDWARLTGRTESPHGDSRLGNATVRVGAVA